MTDVVRISSADEQGDAEVVKDVLPWCMSNCGNHFMNSLTI